MRAGVDFILGQFSRVGRTDSLGAFRLLEAYRRRGNIE